MIGIPSELAPSSLVQYEQVSPVVQRLLKESRALRRRYEWAQAVRCALDARKLCREAGMHVGLAVAQLHLVDFYCDVGELGWAIAHCEEAYQILQRQPARVQRHNEAVAAYALALLHELRLTGGDIPALRWYQEALQQLDVAQEYWATVNASSQIRTCRRACRQIKKRSEQIVAEARTSQHPWRAVFTIWQLDSPDTPFAEHDGVQGYIIGNDRVMIDRSAYRLHSGRFPEYKAGRVNYYFALPVPAGKWAVPGAQAGDYVLIRQQWQVDKENIGVVWEPGNGWMAVGFKRGKDSKIKFFPLHPKIIDNAKPTPGDPAGKVKGCITALLKPEE